MQIKMINNKVILILWAMAYGCSGTQGQMAQDAGLDRALPANSDSNLMEWDQSSERTSFIIQDAYLAPLARPDIYPPLSTEPFAADLNDKPLQETKPKDLIKEIEKLVDQAETCNEKNIYDPTSECHLKAVPFISGASYPERFEKSIGRRVLIFDYGMKLPAIRYRKQVLAYYLHGENGVIQNAFPKLSVGMAMDSGLRLTNVSYKITYDLLGAGFTLIPMAALHEIGKKFKTKFAPVVQDGIIKNAKNWEHGSPIFSKIAELNPNAQFVLVSRDPGKNGCYELNKEKFCKLAELSYDNTLHPLFQRLFLQLEKIVKEWEINFINLSIDANVPRISNAWYNICGGHNANGITYQQPSQEKFYQLMDLYQEFFDKIGSITYTDHLGIQRQVVVVKASPYADGVYSDIKNKFRAHCQTKARYMLRVGIVRMGDELEVPIPIEGSNDVQAILTEPMLRLYENGCNDLYLGYDWGGYEGKWGKYAATFDSIGIGRDFMRNIGMFSSFAVPLGVSYLLYLREKNPQLSEQELLDLVKHGPKIIAPGRYRQHVACEIDERFCLFKPVY